MACAPGAKPRRWAPKERAGGGAQASADDHWAQGRKLHAVPNNRCPPISFTQHACPHRLHPPTHPATYRPPIRPHTGRLPLFALGVAPACQQGIPNSRCPPIPYTQHACPHRSHPATHPAAHPATYQTTPQPLTSACARGCASGSAGHCRAAANHKGTAGSKGNCRNTGITLVPAASALRSSSPCMPGALPVAACLPGSMGQHSGSSNPCLPGALPVAACLSA